MVSYFATAALVISTLAANPQPIAWQADYDEALASTRAASQPLLVVLDDPDAEETRLHPGLLGEDETAGQEFDLLRQYRLCHVDVTTEYGQKVAKAFKTNDFPYTAIIDKTGSVILYSKAGQMNDDEWKEVLTTYRAGNRGGAIATSHTAYKIGADAFPSSPSYRSPGYCPSCQRRSM
jgi:hypothetical protein